jgi:hypothetical protein
MKREELVRVIAELESRVRQHPDDARKIVFDEPDVDTLVASGAPEPDVRRLLSASWWPEMVEDVLDTPSFCGTDEPPEQVLRYARDVVVEYIRKRFPLEAPEGSS